MHCDTTAEQSAGVDACSEAHATASSAGVAACLPVRRVHLQLVGAHAREYVYILCSFQPFVFYFHL
jgi:hypothetical protein